MTETVWVSRTDGKINGVYANKQPGIADEQIRANDPAVLAFLDPLPLPVTILSQDLMAQFNSDDAMKIQTAIAGNVKFWLLWSALQAQSQPMLMSSARFTTGWDALTQVLGKDRMNAIASSLNAALLVE